MAMRITAAGRQNAMSEETYQRIFEMAGDLDDDHNVRLVFTLYAWVLVGRSLDELPSKRDREELTDFVAGSLPEVVQCATSAALLHADAGSRIQ